MKKSFLLTLCAFFIALSVASCASDEEIAASIEASSAKTSVGYGAKQTQTFTFTSATDWTITVDDSSLLSVSPQSGSGGTQTVTLTAGKSNETNDVITTGFTITSKEVKKTVTVTQNPAFHVEQTDYEIGAEGGSIRIYVSTDVDISAGIYYYSDDTFSEMIVQTDKQASSRLYKQSEYFEFDISPNTTSKERVGCLIFTDNNQKSEEACSVELSVTQAAAQTTTSTDFSQDGAVTKLQTHTIGKGLSIAIMGDAFIDREIADGTYAKAMQQAADYLFNIEPMKSLQPYFDVYAITAVSTDNNAGANYSTAFSTQFTSPTSSEITGNDDACTSYAAKALSESELANALLLVVINDTRYAGTCTIYTVPTTAGIANGKSIAYIPMTDGTKYGGNGFEQLLHHEAIGHGIGKLADEYYYNDGTVITDTEKNKLMNWQRYGCFRNVSLYADVSQSYWAHIAADSRYSADQLGAYEGAYTFANSIYRPTQTSIMDDNTGTFNAPSRELIYKRVMYLANNTSWTYNYEDFVAFDAPSRTTTTSRSYVSVKSRFVKPLPQPRIIQLPLR